MNKEMTELSRMARRQGFGVMLSGTEHLRFVSPQGEVVYGPSTPSGRRSITATRLKLRKAGYQDNQDRHRGRMAVSALRQELTAREAAYLVVNCLSSHQGPVKAGELAGELGLQASTVEQVLSGQLGRIPNVVREAGMWSWDPTRGPVHVDKLSQAQQGPAAQTSEVGPTSSGLSSQQDEHGQLAPCDELGRTSSSQGPSAGVPEVGTDLTRTVPIALAVREALEQAVEPVGRAALARAMGVPEPAVAQALGRLLDEGSVRELHGPKPSYVSTGSRGQVVPLPPERPDPTGRSAIRFLVEHKGAQSTKDMALALGAGGPKQVVSALSRLARAGWPVVNAGGGYWYYDHRRQASHRAQLAGSTKTAGRQNRGGVGPGAGHMASLRPAVPDESGTAQLPHTAKKAPTVEKGKSLSDATRAGGTLGGAPGVGRKGPKTERTLHALVTALDLGRFTAAQLSDSTGVPIKTIYSVLSTNKAYITNETTKTAGHVVKVFVVSDPVGLRGLLSQQGPGGAEAPAPASPAHQALASTDMPATRPEDRQDGGASGGQAVGEESSHGARTRPGPGEEVGRPTTAPLGTAAQASVPGYHQEVAHNQEGSSNGQAQSQARAPIGPTPDQQASELHLIVVGSSPQGLLCRSGDKLYLVSQFTVL